MGTMTDAVRITVTKAVRGTYAEQRVAFDAGNLRADWIRADEVERGYLPSWAWERITTLGRADIFVVWSYATPIGWWSRKWGWEAPRVKYSPTTTRHQSVMPLNTMWFEED